MLYMDTNMYNNHSQRRHINLGVEVPLIYMYYMTVHVLNTLLLTLDTDTSSAQTTPTIHHTILTERYSKYCTMRSQSKTTRVHGNAVVHADVHFRYDLTLNTKWRNGNSSQNTPRARTRTQAPYTRTQSKIIFIYMYVKTFTTHTCNYREY